MNINGNVYVVESCSIVQNLLSYKFDKFHVNYFDK